MGVFDPWELARLRRQAAACRVDELVAEWTAGWEGAGHPTVDGLLGWFRRRR